MSNKRHGEKESFEDKMEKDFPYKKFPGEPHALTKKSDRVIKAAERNDMEAPVEIDVKKEKAIKGLDAKQTILKKKEQDLDVPHPLDRHSGTGEPAFVKKEKKGGQGVHNWGTNWAKEDFDRADMDDVEKKVSEAEREGVVGVQSIPYDEYMEKAKPAEIKLQENELKSKISEEELIKDIGNATPMMNYETDDHKDIHHKPLPDDYKVGMNTEHADLLGFQTGGGEEEAPKDIKEKGYSENPIKRAFHFVEEKLGLRPPASEFVQGVYMQDDKAFPKLD